MTGMKTRPAEGNARRAPQPRVSAGSSVAVNQSPSVASGHHAAILQPPSIIAGLPSAVAWSHPTAEGVPSTAKFAGNQTVQRRAGKKQRRQAEYFFAPSPPCAFALNSGSDLNYTPRPCPPPARARSGNTRPSTSKPTSASANGAMSSAFRWRDEIRRALKH